MANQLSSRRFDVRLERVTAAHVPAGFAVRSLHAREFRHPAGRAASARPPRAFCAGPGTQIDCRTHGQHGGGARHECESRRGHRRQDGSSQIPGSAKSTSGSATTIPAWRRRRRCVGQPGRLPGWDDRAGPELSGHQMPAVARGGHPADRRTGARKGPAGAERGWCSFRRIRARIRRSP